MWSRRMDGYRCRFHSTPMGRKCTHAAEAASSHANREPLACILWQLAFLVIGSGPLWAYSVTYVCVAFFQAKLGTEVLSLLGIMQNAPSLTGQLLYNGLRMSTSPMHSMQPFILIHASCCCCSTCRTIPAVQTHNLCVRWISVDVRARVWFEISIGVCSTDTQLFAIAFHPPSPGAQLHHIDTSHGAFHHGWTAKASAVCIYSARWRHKWSWTRISRRRRGSVLGCVPIKGRARCRQQHQASPSHHHHHHQSSQEELRTRALSPVVAWHIWCLQSCRLCSCIAV